MPVVLTEIMERARLVQAAAENIYRLAADIEDGKTTSGTALHVDTLSTMRAKVPAANAAYENADVALRAVLTP